ncbi:MAG: hypothetical protein BSR46_00870 [Candidatus Dactylopiibacterium carminicum]|nr:MAG: hypothetical protein BSR46_00870 [Candidatus Dactylopiibacterium carminicum]
MAISVLLLFLGFSVAGLTLGGQAIRLAGNLPQYESTIRDKLQTLDRLTLGKLNVVVTQADRLVSQLSPESATTTAGGLTPTPVQIVPTHAKPFEVISKIAEAVLPPLQTAGIVLVVLIFILLDYESLRDRMIRLMSGGNLRATTQAISDATERLSRFFVSQFAVNALVGSLVALGLGLAGLSGAMFLGALTAVSRFIPYVGIWLAAGAAMLMAAATSDGWMLMALTAAIYLFIEIVIAQFLEPRLYGHSTGLSPLSVVIAAIFWSALWGPVGLILSTPLTLCLVVAGRHVPALNFLEILLGDLSALTQVERFYQRALAGDSAELVRGLRRFLKDRPLHQFADQVVLPSIRLGYEEFSVHEVTQAEQLRMNSAVSALIDAMSRKPALRKRRRAGAVLDPQVSMTRPAAPRAGQSVLVTGVGRDIADITARILVNVLHNERIEACYLAWESLQEIVPGQGQGIPLVFITCVEPETHAQALGEVLAELRGLLPQARLVVMRVLGEADDPVAQLTLADAGADAVIGGYQEAVQIGIRLLSPEDKVGIAP